MLLRDPARTGAGATAALDQAIAELASVHDPLQITRVTVGRATRRHGLRRYAAHADALAATGRGDFETAFAHASSISWAGELQAQCTARASWVSSLTWSKQPFAPAGTRMPELM